MIKYSLLFMMLLLCPFGLLAQNTGSLTGNVKDASGAVVTKAKVTLSSPTIGTKLIVSTNSEGEYVFPSVAIGQYNLSIEAPTFSNYEQTNITMDAAQNVRADAVLQAASLGQQVMVESNGTTVDTQSGTVGTLIDRELIENLPIDGNNIVSLAALLPGVVDVNAPTTFTDPDSGPTYSANGSTSNANLMLLDGSMWNNVFYNTGLNFPPPQALAEVSVLQNDYKAQYGRNAGSVFNVLTRSGTNSIHGAVWEYAQNHAFNASDYISRLNPKLVQNQFGATIGGPILKNKLQYFVAYQDLRAAQTATAETNSYLPNERGVTDSTGATPLQCSSTGAFAGQNCANFAIAAVQAGKTPNTYLKNPIYYAKGVTTTQLQAAGMNTCLTLLTAAYTSYGEYLPNSEIPSACFNPVTQNILQKYVPYPNQGGTSNLAVTVASLPKNDQNMLIRGDWIAGHNHTVDARYNRQTANDNSSNASSAGSGVATYEDSRNLAQLNFGSIGDTWVITPNILNTLRAGYKRYAYDVLPDDPTTASGLGIGITLYAQSLPTLRVSDRFTLGGSSTAQRHAVNENLQIDDSLSWQHTTHSYQFGVSWLRLQYLSVLDSPGSFTFYNQGYDYAAADFISGLLNAETVSNRSTTASISPNLYLYAQDDWRASSRLTINYGLRYELPFMWKQPNQQAAVFIPGYQSIKFPTAPVDLAFVGDPGVRSTLIPTPLSDLAPRLGFAYDLKGNGRTTLRGGVGLFFDAINASVVGTTQPFYYTATYSSPAGGISQPLLGLNPVPPDYVPGHPSFTAPYSITYPDKNFTTPYTEAGNVGISQRIARGSLSVNYLFKLGRHLLIPVDQNPAIYDCSGAYFEANPGLYCTGASTSASSYTDRVKYPGFNYGGAGVVDLETSATSSYNALQVVGAMRGQGWLSMHASYTYSRALDENSNGLTTSNQVPIVTASISQNYGPSSANATHIFSTGWVVKTPRLEAHNAIVNQVLNHWQFTGTYSARTGHPFTVTTSTDTSLTKESSQRAFLVPGTTWRLPSNRHRAAKVAEWFNTAAFYTPATNNGTFSTQSRNTVIGPAFILADFGLGRSFVIPYRHLGFQFRADAFNVFNTPNLSNPQSAYSGTGLYGQILSTAGSNSAYGDNGRRMQLSLTLHY